MTTVGVIGVGKMGLPIAVNLMQRGFAVVGYRRSGSPALVEAGGAVAASPAEVAERADVLLSILPDAAAVEEVVRGPHGTLTALRPGTVHIEMSTVDVAAKGRIRDAVRARGGDMLDAPISGSPMMVAPRLATTFVSGDPESIEKARPVLDAIAGPWVRTGEFGTGAAMKYVASMLLAAHTVAAAEALAFARRAGLDLQQVQSTLDKSIAASAILAQRGPVMRERAWLPAPGPVDTLYEILRQVTDQAAVLGLTVPVFAAARGVFDRAVEAGCGQLDIACVHDQILGISDEAGSTVDATS
jgi:L-threonate 2-dehydrogenase